MKKIADAALVALMLMASVPGLAEEALGPSPDTVVAEMTAERSSEADQPTGC